MGKAGEMAVISRAVKDKRLRGGVIGAYKIIVRVVGLLLAGAMPISGFAPFGLSFLALERRFSVESIVSAAMVCLGYLGIGDIAFALKYICAALVYMIFLFAAGRGESELSPYVAISCAGVLAAIGRMGEMIWTGFSPGGIIQLVCDAAMVVIGAFVFEKNRGLLLGKRGNLFSLSKEEKLCLAVLAAVLLMGFKSLKIGELLSVTNVAGLWLVAVFSVCGGVGVSAVCGIIVGMIIGLGDELTAKTAVFAVCGVVGGILFRRGKTAVCIGISAAAAALSIYCGELGIHIFGIIDIPHAAAAVIATSDAFIRTVGRITGVRYENTAEERCREFVKNRLSTAADSFRILAATFLDLSDKPNIVDMEDVSMLFDRTADKVCRECSKVGECWVTGFNSTYKSLFKMLEIMERKGELKESDADALFSKKCLRLRAVVKEMNCLFEIYKINCVWKSKLCENRVLAGQQLGSVAQILDDISKEISEEKLDGGTDEEIRVRLAAKGAEATDIDVTLNPKGRYNAYIRFAETDNLEALCRASEHSLRGVLGVQMKVMGIVRTSGGGVELRLGEPEGYAIESGTACVGKGDECGDNCILRHLSGGKFAAALSDGMGTGRKAARDSGATVRLLGDFLEAGFDKGIAVRLINSIMVMKSANEAFATVDMCVIDLFSGEAEFIKNGAEPSYIKRGEGTELVRAASLPVGVVRDMEIETFAHRVKAGDTIVMLSDGIQMKNGYEGWIKDLIDDAEKNMPAQELADRIMDMARALRDGKTEDDMTVIVLKVMNRE